MKRDYRNYFGRSVALIGSSSKGEVLEPLFVDDIEIALDFFGGGELVEAAEEILNSGTEYLHLIRINSDSSYEKYQDLKRAYSILESMNNVDIILPLNLKLDDKIISYPNIFHQKEEFQYKGSKLFKTGMVMESINYVKVRGEKTDYYSLRDADTNGTFDAVIIDDDIFELKYGDTITVDYNCLKKLELEFEILKFVDGRIADSIVLKRVIDASLKTNQLTEKNAAAFFSYDGKEAQYVARSKKRAFNVYTKKDGSGYVYSDFDYQKYVSENTKYEYFVKELAKTAVITNSIAVVKKGSKNYTEMIENILDIKSELNKGIDLGRNIVAVASDCRYSYGTSNYISGYEKALVGLMGSTESQISLTNKKNSLVSDIGDKFSNTEIKGLSKEGYTTLYNSIRNGVVPYKALTLSDDKTFSILKNMRVINEVQSRIKDITDRFIGKGNLNLKSKIYELVTELLDLMVREGKIENYKFKISEASSDYIRTDIELKLINELNEVSAGIVSGS